MRFLEEFAPDEDESPFVPVGTTRKRRLNAEADLALFPTEAPEPLTDQEFMQQNVNPILEKLHSHGIDSLTAAEKTTLDEAAKRLKR
jgi:ABC-type hemin transport system substrate-binding protein